MSLVLLYRRETKEERISISKFNSDVARFFLGPPTDTLRPIIPDNACILCLTAAAGTELADAYSPDTVIASSPGKEVHDPWAFCLHAALLRQAFAHCGKFLTAASRRSLGRVSVPVWLIILSDQLLIVALVRTDDFHHVKGDTLPLSYIPSLLPSRNITA
ncbi:hypothetical protein Cgig2_032369 (chloroplast) [Carnegiea gigantea]|uniref:Uncharacterized protein n=1 Tax=Carnegiea gigantea TaxID=171969 RepID=A0A9Q1GFL8_9CARY|nr:hypothetical protein Cgig2_032369 [Carnegiea gigantea]